MSSDNLKTFQHDTFASLRQLMARSPSASIAALQMQLAQGQFGIGGAVVPPSSLAVGEQYLVFSLAGCEIAIKAEYVQGVERLVDVTLVPNVAPWVKGVINLRGSIASVVDLLLFLGLEPVPHSPRTRLLSLQFNEMVICFVVDGVNEMLPIPAAAIASENMRQTEIPSWAAPYAAGRALIANRSIILLDVTRLLFSEKMQHYQS